MERLSPLVELKPGAESCCEKGFCKGSTPILCAVRERLQPANPRARTITRRVFMTNLLILVCREESGSWQGTGSASCWNRACATTDNEMFPEYGSCIYQSSS